MWGSIPPIQLQRGCAGPQQPVPQSDDNNTGGATRPTTMVSEGQSVTTFCSPRGDSARFSGGWDDITALALEIVHLLRQGLVERGNDLGQTLPGGRSGKLSDQDLLARAVQVGPPDVARPEVRRLMAT